MMFDWSGRSISALLLLGLLGGVPAYAQSYTAYSLGKGSASGINESGAAIGDTWIGQSQYSFYAGANAQAPVPIGSSSSTVSVTANGINDAGLVAGGIYNTADGSTQAYIYNTTTQSISMLGYPTGGTWSSANGINASGQVVGDSSAGAFITDANGQNMRIVGALPGSAFSNANSGVAINASGQVTGYALMRDRSMAGFITGANGAGLTPLSVIPNTNINQPTSINASGQVAGYAYQGTSNVDQSFAYITGANGVGYTLLGALPGSTYTQADGLNDLGQVVGQAFMGSGSTMTLHAFITGANGAGITDLNTLVQLPSEVYLFDAVGINNVGQIVADGSDGNVYLLSPVPEPSTGFLMSLGLMVGLGMMRRQTAIA